MENMQQLQPILNQLDTNRPLLDARSVYVIYKGKGRTENVVALSGLNLKARKGEFLAVVGPSGSGKSSLLRVLGGLQTPSAGAVLYHGVDISKYDESQLVPFRRQMVGFVFQEGNLLPSYSGFQNVVQTLRYAGKSYSEAEKRAEEVLGMLGLKSRMHAMPHKMSGGERQRVGIARALANEPQLVLADEPTGNIDYANTDNVMGIFRDLHKELNTSFMIVTHSDHVASYADRRLELRDGKFTSQLDVTADLDALSEARSLIINDDGTVTFPPEMLDALAKYGNLWDFKFDVSNGDPKIIGTPVKKTQSTGNAIDCPVCGNKIKAENFYCNQCGAKVR